MQILVGEKDLIAGFAALVAVFVLQYLVLPAGIPVNLPANERLILFYSKDCKHCTEVIQELDEKKINVVHLPVQEYARFLKNMGIENVPTLMVTEPYQKIFLTGKDPIIRYLLACTASAAAAGKEGKKTSAPKKAEKTSLPEAGPTIDIFSQPDLLTAPAPSGADEGMCREDEICK